MMTLEVDGLMRIMYIEMDKYTLQKDFKAEKTDTAGHIKRIRDEANEYRKTFNRLDNDI